MKILKPFEQTTLNQTKPGDLIRISHSLAPLGIVIHAGQSGKPVVGVVQDNRGVPPYHIVYQRNFACFRYSPGWALDLPPQRAIFGSTEFRGIPGAVHIGATGTLMNFAAAEPSQFELTVNLNTFEFEDIGGDAAAFPFWQIWASEADMTSDRAEPILRVTAQLPPAA